MRYEITEAHCRHCGRAVKVIGGMFVNHGPGKDSFFCDGSGKLALGVSTSDPLPTGTSTGTAP